VSDEMNLLVDDLVAEQETLDAQLRDVPAARWETPSPADGWLLRDCIAHLTEFDQTAAFIAETREPMPRGGPPPAPPLSGRQAEARALTVEELIVRWRDARTRLAVALRPLDPKTRLPWAGPTMSARSFGTARLMECWSHGLDAIEAAGKTPVDSDRLRHIAQLGFMTREFAYRTRGMDAPAEPLRVELEAPSGALWTWGPEDAPQRIRGSAGEFCRVVTQGISYLDTALKTEGEGAAEFLRVAQAFAGPPGPGRPPRGKPA